jgi:hypothetical protein
MGGRTRTCSPRPLGICSARTKTRAGTVRETLSSYIREPEDGDITDRDV